MSKIIDTAIKRKTPALDKYIEANSEPYVPADFQLMNKLFINRKLNHVIFWVVVTLMATYYGSLFGGSFIENFINIAVLLPIQIIGAYLLVYIQIPQWFFKGHWLKFLVSFLGIAFILSVLARLFVLYVAEPLMGIDDVKESLWEVVVHPFYLVQVYLMTLYIPAFMLFLIKMTKERFAQQNRVEILKKEKKTAELNFLKAQMNPHFLFNTLNNIYSLSIQKSDHTSEMIMKLSEILDYTIYDCHDDRVAVAKEWELIQNYADLEVLRYAEVPDVQLYIEMQNEESTIAPLILLSIVENAFKHSLKGKKSNSAIKITLVEKGGVLDFKVFNTKSKSAETSPGDKNGIGKTNVQRQLELQYPGRHTLSIAEEALSYTVHLTIQL